jgi:hypothetical protein
VPLGLLSSEEHSGFSKKDQATPGKDHYKKIMMIIEIQGTTTYSILQ